MRLRRSALVIPWLLVATSVSAQAPAAALQDEAVRWLQSYIRVDTINPPGNEAAGVQFFKTILDAEGIPYETGETELQDLFSKVGQVDSVRVMRDMATGRARGFAFVEMATDEEAQKAVTELNQAQLGGRTLAVNEARPKPEYSGGGGGFGGGRGKGGGGGGRRREPRW